MSTHRIAEGFAFILADHQPAALSDADAALILLARRFPPDVIAVHLTAAMEHAKSLLTVTLPSHRSSHNGS